MKQISWKWVLALVLFAGAVGAATEPAGPAVERYQALTAEGKQPIAAMDTTLREFGSEPDQVSAVVARTLEDNGDLEGVAVAAVGAVIAVEQLDSICPALGVVLDMAASKQEATLIAAAVLNSITGDTELDEAARQEVINCALAHGIDPPDLLEAAAAIGGERGGTPPPSPPADGGGSPASPS